MRTNKKRVQVPFLFRAADGLGANGKLIARSYGAEIEGVFTRAGTAMATDANGILHATPHSRPRLGVTGSAHAALLEGATTNYLLRSQEMDHAAWGTKTNVTVTANATTAPDGTLTADKVEATAGPLTTTFGQTEATISSTAVTFSIYGKVGSGNTDCNQFRIRNATGGAQLYITSINWSTGAITPISGTGTTRVTNAGNGWWRVQVSVTTGLTAGDDVECNAGFTASTEAAGEYAYFWGAQLEATSTASSYVATTSATAARVADALYFPFTLPPQALTVYSRHIEMGAGLGSTDRGLWSIGGDANASLFVDGGSGDYTAYLRLASDTSSTPTHTAALGDIVETRVTLASTGAITCNVTLNAGTEATGSASAAATLPSAWNLARFYLGSRNSVPGPSAFTHACVALGSKTLAEMRVLAEVS